MYDHIDSGSFGSTPVLIAYRTVDSAGAEVLGDLLYFFLERFSVKCQALHRVGHIKRAVFLLAQKHKTEKLQGVDVSLHLIHYKIGTVPDIALVVIDAGDDRDPQDDPGCFPGQGGQVREDEFISNTGILAVSVRIHAFQVGNEQIRNREDFIDDRFGNAQRRFQTRVDAFAAAGCKELSHKGTLKQRFPARDGHAAAAFLIVAAVPQDDIHAFLNGHHVAPPLYGVARADIAAVHAVRAQVSVDGRESTVLKYKSVAPGTYVGASAAAGAADAAACVDSGLRLRELALRIAAPSAAERTSFQEQFRAHYGTIMDGKPLNIKDCS